MAGPASAYPVPAAGAHPTVGGKQPMMPVAPAAAPAGSDSLSSASSDGDEDDEDEDDDATQDGDFQEEQQQAEGSGSSSDDGGQQQQQQADDSGEDEVVRPRIKLVSRGKQRQVLDDPEDDPELYGLRRSVRPATLIVAVLRGRWWLAPSGRG